MLLALDEPAGILVAPASGAARRSGGGWVWGDVVYGTLPVLVMWPADKRRLLGGDPGGREEMSKSGWRAGGRRHLDRKNLKSRPLFLIF